MNASLVAGPGSTANDPVPNAFAAVAVTVTCPAVVAAVKLTVAMPFASVSDVGALNNPLAPVLDHVTVFPARSMGALFASLSWADMVAVEPMVVPLDVTTNRAGPAVAENVTGATVPAVAATP